MNRSVAILLAFVFMIFIFPCMVLAESTPTAMSYFTNPNYNKTFTAEDGLQHTMTVTWVGETWNKIGTVIYSINYEETYQRGNDSYIDVKSATEIYENARPSYPNCSEYSVYTVKWYGDGSSEVVYDYRPASPPDPTPAPTPVPTPEPTAPPTPAPIPTPEPTVKPTVAATATLAPTITPIVTSIAASEAVIGASPSQSITATPNAAERAVVPAMDPVQSTNASRSWWAWLVVILIVIVAAVSLGIFVNARRRKRGKHEGHQS